MERIVDGERASEIRRLYVEGDADGLEGRLRVLLSGVGGARQARREGHLLVEHPDGCTQTARLRWCVRVRLRAVALDDALEILCCDVYGDEDDGRVEED